ncbi:tyrosine-type recombinase/integrase [Heliobacillus mobilis]|uniref:Tyrosine-type recombinase/integrase n=1 Tax=Heliobacterium mobile TaxID=28064 RepID=A0A6I3SKZ8_HELMO|nr:tyrosine-type recombinase/integrase [Heliobacterium mobile]MTV49611.1 tyrosine-type recombinase/integrase [Heliobacterium mobile]
MIDTPWCINHSKVLPQTQAAANEYLQSLQVSKRSEATIKKYRSILQRFFIECPKELTDLTPEDILLWLRTTYGEKKERTMELVITVLSNFFTFCLEEEYVHKVLVKSRWRPKIPKSLPKFLNRNELARVKFQADLLPLRERVLVAFLLTSGCRRSEAAGINLEDVDLKSQTAIVLGKGKRIRKVHFSIECALLLKQYLTERTADSPALFLDKNGQRVKPGGIYRLTRKVGKKAGLLARFSPHVCRHTFATNLLSRGAELEFIGDELGHRDLNTTRTYARTLSEQIIRAYKSKMGNV